MAFCTAFKIITVVADFENVTIAIVGDVFWLEQAFFLLFFFSKIRNHFDGEIRDPCADVISLPPWDEKYRPPAVFFVVINFI